MDKSVQKQGLGAKSEDVGSAQLKESHYAVQRIFHEFRGAKNISIILVVKKVKTLK